MTAATTKPALKLKPVKIEYSLTPLTPESGIVNREVERLPLRPYQQEQLNKLYQAFLDKTNTCLQSPTGTGKGLVIARFVGKLYQHGINRIMIIVPNQELVENIQKYFYRSCIGIYGGSKYQPHYAEAIIISTYQSAYKHVLRYRPQVLISDEAHKVACKTWDKVINAVMGALHFGFTATPNRLDGKGLDKYFKKLIPSPPIQWFIDQDYLPDYELHLSDCPVFKGKTDNLGKQSEIFGSVPQVEQTVTQWLDYCSIEEQSLFFVTTREHGYSLLNKFLDLGLTPEQVRFIHSTTPKKQRNKDYSDFQDGKYPILINITIFKEGIDVPQLKNLFLDRFTFSTALYIQIVGRLFRGKAKKRFFDNAGNSWYHGSPNLDFAWSLRGQSYKANNNKSSLYYKCENDDCQANLVHKKWVTDFVTVCCCECQHENDLIPVERRGERVIKFKDEHGIFKGEKNISKHTYTAVTRILFKNKSHSVHYKINQILAIESLPKTVMGKSFQYLGLPEHTIKFYLQD